MRYFSSVGNGSSTTSILLYNTWPVNTLNIFGGSLFATKSWSPLGGDSQYDFGRIGSLGSLPTTVTPSVDFLDYNAYQPIQVCWRAIS